MIEETTTEDDVETRRWVSSHVIGLFASIGAVIGLMIADAKVEEIIGAKSMPFFRSVLLVSVLLAGLGARAILAWRSATFDLQGRIFLTLTGLILLTGAAFGMANCGKEIHDHTNPRPTRPAVVPDIMPIQTALPRHGRANDNQANFEKSGLRRSKNARNASAASGEVSRWPNWATSSVITSSMCRA
jgi:hypothetical protein